MQGRGGLGRRRAMAAAAIVLALSVAAPEFAPSAEAAPARSGSSVVSEMQAQPAAHTQLVAKRKKRRRKKPTAARRRAVLVRFMRGHPKRVARYLKSHPAQAKLRLAAVGGIKNLKKKRPKAVKAHLKKKKKPLKKKAKKGAKAKKKKKKGAKGGAAAKKKKAKSHPLGITGWGEILLLALLPFAAVVLLLLFTDRTRRPKTPSPSRRRRTLVITPMNRTR